MIAVGNFDGVHLGHRVVFSKTLEIAATENLSSVALTFTPHPRNFFSSNNPVKIITDDDYKRDLILALGIENVYFQKFDSDFAALNATEFVKYLITKFSCAAIVCGTNFRFGKGAAFDTNDLCIECQKNGIHLYVVGMNDLQGDLTVSSSLIRSFLENGDPAKAAKFLGRPFSVSAPVFPGKQLGSQIGFPTVNQKLRRDSVVPKLGVYAGFVDLENKRYRCIVNIGYRPTVNDNAEDIDVETYIFDFSGNLYGKVIRVFLTDYIREERKFDTPYELSRQIKSDCRFVRENDLFN